MTVPTKITKDDGLRIAQSLDTYYQDHGQYPETLNELVPMYIDELNQPASRMYGWLYYTTVDKFTLGYVWYVGRDGYELYVITETDRDWMWLQHVFGGPPFYLPPTAGPRNGSPQPFTLRPPMNIPTTLAP